jgi:hypothetical protein
MPEGTVIGTRRAAGVGMRQQPGKVLWWGTDGASGRPGGAQPLGGVGSPLPPGFSPKHLSETACPSPSQAATENNDDAAAPLSLRARGRLDDAFKVNPAGRAVGGNTMPCPASPSHDGKRVGPGGSGKDGRTSPMASSSWGRPMLGFGPHMGSEPSETRLGITQRPRFVGRMAGNMVIKKKK